MKPPKVLDVVKMSISREGAVAVAVGGSFVSLFLFCEKTQNQNFFEGLFLSMPYNALSERI